MLLSLENAFRLAVKKMSIGNSRMIRSSDIVGETLTLSPVLSILFCGYKYIYCMIETILYSGVIEDDDQL